MARELTSFPGHRRFLSQPGWFTCGKVYCISLRINQRLTTSREINGAHGVVITAVSPAAFDQGLSML